MADEHPNERRRDEEDRKSSKRDRYQAEIEGDGDYSPPSKRQRGGSPKYVPAAEIDYGLGSDGEVEPVIIEQTEVFRIFSDTRHQLLEAYELDHPDLQFQPVDSASRMSESGIVASEEVLALWEQKNRMDTVFDNKQSQHYYSARDSLFPQDKKGSTRFWNRAGDKLQQVVDAVNLLDGLKSFVFIDLCGGPGSFSQLLLEHAEPEPSSPLRCLQGFGMTLKMPNTPQSDVWYRQLESHPLFKILYGTDGTGNVYYKENLQFLRQEAKTWISANPTQTDEKDESAVEQAESDEDPGSVQVFVCDGGFEIRKSSDGRHMENYQELFSGRILLSEVLSMLQTLREGGRFVCKLFDTFSKFTTSLLYILASTFDECYIVKPQRSRIVNSERYVVGKGLVHTPRLRVFRSILEKVHDRFHDHNERRDASQSSEAKDEDRGTGDPHQLSPNSLVPQSIIETDKAFLTSMHDMVEALCKKQTLALKRVMDMTEAMAKGRRSAPPSTFDRDSRFERRDSRGSGGRDRNRDGNRDGRNDSRRSSGGRRDDRRRDDHRWHDNRDGGRRKDDWGRDERMRRTGDRQDEAANKGTREK